jgi:hypothetical protein
VEENRKLPVSAVENKVTKERVQLGFVRLSPLYNPFYRPGLA